MGIKMLFKVGDRVIDGFMKTGTGIHIDNNEYPVLVVLDNSPSVIDSYTSYGRYYTGDSRSIQDITLLES